MPNLSKMSQTTGKPMPHLGNMVTKYMQQQKVTRAQLARGLGSSDTTLMRCLRQHTIHAALLWKMGQLLNHNFFADVAAEFEQEAKPTAQEQLLLLQSELAAARQEVEVYKKVVDVLKKIL